MPRPITLLLALHLLVPDPVRAAAIDLLRIEPVEARGRLDLTVALEDIVVTGAASSRVRQDTLEVVLTGSPARIEFRMPTQAGDVLDRARLTLAASEVAWIQPLLARGDQEAPAGAPLAIGEPARITLELHDRVLKSPRGGLAHVVLGLPPIVGRVKLAAPIEFGGSPAPRRIARLQDVVTECRALRVGQPATWKLRLPKSPRLRIDLAHASRSHPDEKLTLRVHIAQKRGRTAVHDFALDVSTSALQADPWTPIELDLDAYGGKEVTLGLEAISSHAAVRGSQLLLGNPRIVDLRAKSSAVLVIVVDTLRDEDPATASNAARSRITQLASASIDFRRAYANSSWTLPSTGSLLASWLPSRHGLGHGSASTTQLHPEAPTFAGTLRAAGWSTAAVSANPIVSPGTGLERGFDHFDLRPSRDPHTRAAEVTVDAALDWLRARRGEPWFLYAHFFDPHDRYQAPDPWRTRFVSPDRRPTDHEADVWQGSPNGPRDAILESGTGARRSDIDLLAELYRGEVGYVDEQIGALLDSLARWGELDRLAVVFTSDHGEEFLEHGMLKHGHALHEELVAVPLLMRLPGHEPAVVETPVSLVDVAPTLTSWLGLQPVAGDGRDLLANWPQPPPTVPVIAELVSRVEHVGWAGEWISVIDGRWKWVRTPRGEQLFELDRDPGEARDVSAAHPDHVERLGAIVDALRQEDRPLAASVAEDPRRLELLRSLGYIR